MAELAAAGIVELHRQRFTMDRQAFAAVDQHQLDVVADHSFTWANAPTVHHFDSSNGHCTSFVALATTLEAGHSTSRCTTAPCPAVLRSPDSSKANLGPSSSCLVFHLGRFTSYADAPASNYDVLTEYCAGNNVLNFTFLWFN